MSAFGPKRTSLVALHMSAIGGKADMTFALHMSAYDPKQTSRNRKYSWRHGFGSLAAGITALRGAFVLSLGLLRVFPAQDPIRPSAYGKHVPVGLNRCGDS
jgi:hypothetical protein